MKDYFTKKERQRILSFVGDDALRNCGLTVASECLIINDGTFDEVVSFIKKRRPSVKAQIELIKRSDINLIDMFFKHRYQFSEDAVNFLCETACDEIVMLQLEKGFLLPEKAQNAVADRQNHKMFMTYAFFTSEYAQLIVLKRNNEDEINKMLVSAPLTPKAQKTFLQTATTEQVLDYISHSNERFSDVRPLFEREVKEEILAYLQKFWLGEQDVLLFERANEYEINAYLCSRQAYTLSKKAQTMLLNRGVHSEIKTYILFGGFFSDKNEVLLVNRHNREEIMAYIYRRRLSKAATLAFIKWASTEDIITFMNAKNSDNMSIMAQKSLLARAVEEEILTYITNVDANAEGKGFAYTIVPKFLKTRTSKELIAYIDKFDIDEAEEKIIIKRGLTEVMVHYAKNKYIHNPALIINRGNKQEVRALFESMNADVDFLLARDEKINQLLKTPK